MYKNSAARQRVLRHLLEYGPSTVAELAARLGTVPVTVRSHLAALEEQGLVGGADERGRVGRPRRRYHLTGAARALLPHRQDGLALDLLDSLQALAGPRGVDQVLDIAASRYAASCEVPASGALEERVAAAAAVLTAESGLARWEDGGDWLLIRDFHCPYGELPLQRPELCRYHAQVVTRLLGRPVTLDASIAHGAEHCVFKVARHPAPQPAAVRTVSDGRPAPERK